MDLRMRRVKNAQADNNFSTHTYRQDKNQSKNYQFNNQAVQVSMRAFQFICYSKSNCYDNDCYKELLPFYICKR
jgi:hypothetical protein